MNKSIILSALLLGSAGANAAYTDLSSFTFTSGTGQASTNLITLTATPDREEGDAIVAGAPGSGLITVPGLYSFEYMTSGNPSNITMVLLGTGQSITLTSSESFVRQAFDAPYSGIINITVNKPGVGSNTLMLRNFSDAPIMAAVPEPETYAMLMAGLAMTGLIARRHKKKGNPTLESRSPRELVDT